MTSLLYDKNIEEIETLINDHLHINQQNKVSQGEVFTPMWLILEMLETFWKCVTIWEILELFGNL